MTDRNAPDLAERLLHNLLQQGTDVFARDRFGQSLAVYFLNYYKDESVLALLIRSVKTWKDLDNDGNTIFHQFAYHPKPGLVDLVLENDSNYHKKNTAGMTPLDIVIKELKNRPSNQYTDKIVYLYKLNKKSRMTAEEFSTLNNKIAWNADMIALFNGDTSRLEKKSYDDRRTSDSYFGKSYQWWAYAFDDTEVINRIMNMKVSINPEICILAAEK